MKEKIALLCDSSADISEEEAHELGIHVLRMPVIIDGEEFIEGINIFDEDIYDALKQQKKIVTTQPSIGSLIKKWDELLEDYDKIFYLPLSKHLSGTCMNAIGLANTEYKGKVTVVESEFVCYPIIYMLQVAKEMFQKGYTCEQVKQKIEQEGELFAILIPENLTTLKNGGRISPAAAKLAGMLKIHPLLKVEHGAIDVQDKVRTISKAYKAGIEYAIEGIDPKDYDWMIIHAFNEDVSQQLKIQLEAATGQHVEQKVFKSVIMSHTGEGTIGFGRIKKIRWNDQ